jgi:hypothetical protein
MAGDTVSAAESAAGTAIGTVAVTAASRVIGQETARAQLIPPATGTSERPCPKTASGRVREPAD